MTRTKLLILLCLLKAYRAALTWSFGQDHDVPRQNCDAVIHDVRFALRNGGFYNHPAFQVAEAAE